VTQVKVGFWQIVLKNSASASFRVLDVQDAGPDRAHRPY
jgi:hypothetical protein